MEHKDAATDESASYETEEHAVSEDYDGDHEEVEEGVQDEEEIPVTPDSRGVDSRLVRKLTKMTFPKRTSKILEFLIDDVDGSVESKKIEKETGLPQPKVSLGTKDLRDRDWLKTVEVDTPGKGRPRLEFELIVDNQDIFEELKEEALERIEEEKEDIEELREELLENRG